MMDDAVVLYGTCLRYWLLWYRIFWVWCAYILTGTSRGLDLPLLFYIKMAVKCSSTLSTGAAFNLPLGWRSNLYSKSLSVLCPLLRAINARHFGVCLIINSNTNWKLKLQNSIPSCLLGYLEYAFIFLKR